VMTVGQLAEQQGITLKEAVALCVVSGVSVKGPDTTLTPADVARVHDVLEGKVQLPDPKATASKKLGSRESGANPTGRLLGVAAVLLLVVGLAVTGVLFLRRGDSRVLRAKPDDCFNAELVGVTVIPSTLKVVPCDGPHGFRAFGTIDLDEVYKTWPGAEEIERYAQERCPTLAGASGLQRARILYVGPGDEALWNDPSTSRNIVCAAPQRDWDRARMPSEN